MKKLTILLTLFFIPILMMGQSKMSVSDFYMDIKDPTANLEGTMVYDQNGDKCALIKIKTTEKGFNFDTGSLGVIKSDENHTAEVWVYIPHGARRITISHKDLGQITYEFPIQIEKGRTYVMKLTSDRVFTATFDDKHSQRLILHITPRVATVKMNGAIENVSNGVLDKTYSFGRYRYVITADKYHKLEDTITINNPNEPQVRYVRLKQAWGYLTFDNYSDLSEAKLYVDNEDLGNISSQPFDILSGKHDIKIVKPLYETYEQEINIKDSVTTNLAPQMIENFGDLSLRVPDEGASIYIDGEHVGTGTYSGKVGSGKHIVECRKEFHRSTTKDINVVTGTKTSYVLESPVPIYSSIHITTNNYIPVKVKIDNGNDSDPTSDFYNDKVLIGPHTIYVSQKGYRSQQFDVNLKEGEAFEKELTMESVVRVNFTSHPTIADLYIDHAYVGSTPYEAELSTGSHHILMTKDGYSSYEGDNDFKRDEMTFNKHLLRIYYKKNEFYIEGGAQAPMLMAWYGAIGFYAANVNVEGFYMGGFQKSERLSFNPTNKNSNYFSAELLPKAFFGGKIGYGINFHGRFRMTPQIGVGITQVSIDKNSVEATNTSGSYYSSSTIPGIEDGDLKEATYAISAIGDIKFQFALTKNISFVITPSYSFAVKKNKLYEELEKASSKIKGWATGFNCAAGFNFYF